MVKSGQLEAGPDEPGSSKPGGPGSPAAAAAQVELAFFQRLAELELALASTPGAGQLVARVHAGLSELETTLHPLIRNELDASNVRFVALAVAAYDVLRAIFPHEQAMGGVDECLNQPLRAQVLAGTRQMLDTVPDPFEALVAVSKEREASWFGPSFEFERPLDDGFGYVLSIQRCLFHEALQRCGRAELQPLLCRFDLNWIDAIDPARHRLRFVRPSTFASADRCRMWFMRVETLSEQQTPRRLPVYG